jgi:uncharacterized lipoprotein NlpE involved in copper resistance
MYKYFGIVKEDIMNRVFMIILTIIMLLVISCKSKSIKDSLDWVGVYHTTLPAASAPGIDVTIILEEGDYYHVSYHYIDTDPEEETFIFSGNFSWDDKGEVITLHTSGDEPRIPPYYRVGKSKLTQLNLDKQEITGQLADMYVFEKIE